MRKGKTTARKIHMIVPSNKYFVSDFLMQILESGKNYEFAQCFDDNTKKKHTHNNNQLHIHLKSSVENLLNAFKHIYPLPHIALKLRITY